MALPFQTVRDLDAKLYHSFVVCFAPDPGQVNLGITVEPSRNWNNLMEWSKLVHATGQGGLKPLDPKHQLPSKVVLNTALNVAFHYRTKRASWEECKQALSNHYDVAVAYDPQWKRKGEVD